MTVTKHHLVVVLGKGYFTSENRAQTVVFGDIWRKNVFKSKK